MIQSPDRLRVVVDCNTLVQAMADPGCPGARCLDLAEAGRIEILTSRDTLKELREVVRYERVRALLGNLSEGNIDAFIRRLQYRSTRVRSVRSVFAYPRDPDDERYIHLAMSGGAGYLVTQDKDLLSLMTGHSAICKRFRRLTRPLRVVRPVEFLRILRQGDP